MACQVYLEDGEFCNSAKILWNIIYYSPMKFFLILSILMQLIFLRSLTLDMTLEVTALNFLHTTVELTFVRTFSECIVSVWNGLSATDKDFNSLRSFRSCIMKADLSKYLCYSYIYLLCIVVSVSTWPQNILSSSCLCECFYV
jgi:hypothetical protein